MSGACCQLFAVPAVPFLTRPLQLSGTTIQRVSTCKILGVHISEDLTWNIHTDYVVKKSNKRLSTILKNAGVATEDLVEIHCSFVRSVLEYAPPNWSDLPDYLASDVESIQKRALKIILPTYDYAEALNVIGLQFLSVRRQQACIKFVDQAKNKIPLNDIISKRAEVVCHGYNLRSGITKTLKRLTVG